MAAKGSGIGRTHGNGTGAIYRGAAVEFDRSINKAGYVDDTPVPVIVIDCDHTIEFMNRAAALLAGCSPEASVGRKLWEVFDMAECRNGSCPESHAMREGHVHSGESDCTIKGRTVPVRAYASPRYDDQNKLIGAIAVLEDNSEEKRFADEISRLVGASLEGKLQERGKSEGFHGRYRDLLAEINTMLEAVIGPLNVAAGYIDAISKGDLPPVITIPYPGEFNAIKNNLNQCIESLSSLTAQTNHMSAQHDLGEIDVIIPPEQFQGAYRTMAEGVNKMVLGHVSVKKKAMACVAEFGKGNFEAELEKFPGKKAFINDNLERLRANIKSFIAEMNHMSEAHSAGDIDVVIPEEKFEGSYRSMATGVNSMVLGHISVKKKAMACVAEFGRGNFNAELEKFPGKKAFINDNIERLRANIKSFIEEMKHMSDAHTAGDIDVIIPEEKFEGSYREMAKGVNEMAMGHISVKKKAMACIKQFGEGNFEAQLEKFPGKKAFINDTIEQVRSNLKALITDADMLVQAAVQGKLSTRADANCHHGDFRKIVQGVNSTLDAVVNPMQDVSAVLSKLAGGDFTALVTSKYTGDFELLTNAVNTVSQTVRAALDQMGRSVASLSSSAEELNRVSQSMGSSADETATQASVVSAAAEQVSNNVQTVATGADEMGASIKEIAKNTAEATRVASSAVRTAEMTNETISKLGQSSTEIGQVIKVITSIAQQTNLLALNATIEAARAGEAGKGFAVVANEVKELAKETAKATEDISRKIEAIQGDTNGAVSAISQISQVIGQISDIQTTIASAIEEQSATTNEIGRTLAEAAKGSTDISKNIGGVAEAAHATTVGATETSKSAQSLEKMANELRTLISQFRF